jgi:hypothetical protein
MDRVNVSEWSGHSEQLSPVVFRGISFEETTKRSGGAASAHLVWRRDHFLAKQERNEEMTAVGSQLRNVNTENVSSDAWASALLSTTISVRQV